MSERKMMWLSMWGDCDGPRGIDVCFVNGPTITLEIEQACELSSAITAVLSENVWSDYTKIDGVWSRDPDGGDA